MSQSRTRRAASGAREPARPPGDTNENNPLRNHRSKSRNKIPKSVRYDLENALLGLCDVWFEEIKPHLIQNNIKLHVEGAAHDDVTADGDHRRAHPACAHLDPGAASDRRQRQVAGFAACCPTQPVASRAPCHRRRSPCLTSLHSPLPPTKPDQVSGGRQPLPPRLLPTLRSSPEAAIKRVRTNAQRANSTTQTQTQTKKSRKTKCPLPEASTPDKWRVPRLCRMYAPKIELPRTLSTSPTPPSHSVNKVSPESQSIPRDSNGISKETLKWKKRAQPKENIDMIGTSAAALSVKHKKKKKIKDEEVSSLFSPGLISIIGEKHDKRIRVLYKNPVTEESCPSIMNLVAPSETRRKKRTVVVKKMPWR